MKSALISDKRTQEEPIGVDKPDKQSDEETGVGADGARFRSRVHRVSSLCRIPSLSSSSIPLRARITMSIEAIAC